MTPLSTKSLPSLAAQALALRLLLARAGAANIAAVLLALAAAVLWLWAIPHARQGVAQERRGLARAGLALADASKAKPAPAQSGSRQHLADFYAALGRRADAEQQVRRIFAIAADAGIALTQAEYKHAFDKGGQFATYQITLPVKGSYGAIRRFSEQVLLALPYASLDQVGFKRDAIAANVVDAQLRLTLYLKDDGARPAAGAAPADSTTEAWE